MSSLVGRLARPGNVFRNWAHMGGIKRGGAVGIFAHYSWISGAVIQDPAFYYIVVNYILLSFPMSTGKLCRYMYF